MNLQSIIRVTCAFSLALMPLATAGIAYQASPFVGVWRAIDQVDESLIRVAIWGPVFGRFFVTWSESYFTFCDGPNGLGIGTGSLDPEDSNILEVDMRLGCFRTGATVRWHQTWQYRPDYGVLASLGDYDVETIWSRFPRPLVPQMDLRVNYGHDWVESFYEPDHTVWIAVENSEGDIQGTAEVVTEPQEMWDGATGFQTQDGDWADGRPDIQPGDWVVAQVDNGQTAKVQIGEIEGEIDLEADDISGTVLADWFSEELFIICDPWGLSDLSEYRESSVLPDGEDTFGCSWSGVLDILRGQELGVWYYGLDGHAVVNAFSTPFTRFTVWPGMAYLEGYEWPDGEVVSISVADKEACYSEAAAGYPEWDPINTFFSVEFPGSCTIVAHDLVTLATDGLSMTHEVQELALGPVDLEADTVSGTAEFDVDRYSLHTWIHGIDESYMELSAEGGAWLADFGSHGFNLQPGMGGRVEIVDQASNATAIEWTTPPQIGLRVNYGHNWVESFYEGGHEVVVTVTDEFHAEKATATIRTGPRDDWGGEPGFSTVDTPQAWSPAPPELQPYDWVYAQVDNGVTAQVQLGDIHGEVVIGNDRITGSIEASWLDNPVPVECLDWGSGQDPPADNKDGGMIQPDGEDTYSCIWDSAEWDIQAWQEVGVGYFTPDGHWVANAFHAEHWTTMWMHKLETGSLSVGEHRYYFHWAFDEPYSDHGTSQPPYLTVSSNAEFYDGYVLAGPWADRPLQAWTGETCEVVTSIHPDQPTRLVWSWVNDYSMIIDEAAAHFDSFKVKAYWDWELGGSAAMVRGDDLVQFFNREARWDYMCDFTDHP